MNKTVLEPKYRYDFPPGGGYPFDSNSRGNYFAFADESFSGTADTRGCLVAGNNLIDNIPMGRLAIMICYRLALIENGRVLSAWNPENLNIIEDKHGIGGKFCAYIDKPIERLYKARNKMYKTMVIYKSDTEEPDSTRWNSFEECREFSIGCSKKKRATLLVSVIIESIPWY